MRTMIRAGVLAAQVLVLAAVAVADAARAADGVQCTTREPANETLEIECALPAAGAARRFRFKADFVGSHDDTVISMTATLDGKPFTCGDGSKTELRYLDGEVSLECTGALARDSGAQTFVAQVRWFHAQYTAFTFALD